VDCPHPTLTVIYQILKPGGQTKDRYGLSQWMVSMALIKVLSRQNAVAALELRRRDKEMVSYTRNHVYTEPR
jgi:hypothetical protein